MKLTPDGTYTDPTGHAENREAVVQRITAHLQKRPGMQIVPVAVDGKLKKIVGFFGPVKELTHP